jgi:molybdopterin converting factor small subunit
MHSQVTISRNPLSVRDWLISTLIFANWTASKSPHWQQQEEIDFMAVKVTLPTAFTRHTDGRKQFDSTAENLSALLSDIDQTFPALATQIKDDDGKLRRFINIYVNDEDIRFLGGETYAFQDGDEIMLIPSIAGGC